MELLEAKVIAMTSLAVGTMLIGMLPRWCFLRAGRDRSLFTSTLLCFGGGVLLSTSLVHMLPEIREAMNGSERFAEVLLCVGFFALYFVDEIVHCLGGEHGHGHHGGERPNYGAATDERRSLLYGRQDPYNPSFAPEDAPPSQFCHIGHEEPCQNGAAISSLALTVALTVHSLLEGLAVGLEDSASKVMLLFGAISSHKLVVGFSLGVELTTEANRTNLYHLLSIAVFSIGSPLGIGLGMTVSSIPSKINDVLLPIVQCFAAGTLLYVSVSEVLPRERAYWHRQTNRRFAGILQFVAVATGFAVMTLLSRYMES